MRNRKLLIIFLLVSTMLMSSFAFYGYQMLYSPNLQVEKEDRLLKIDKNETFKSLQDKLYDGYYVQDLVAFSFLARLMEYDKAVKPGKYVIKKDMTNLEAIRLLRLGQQRTVNVTFTHVRLKQDLAEKVTANLDMTKAEFDSALVEFIVNNDYGFNDYNIISMFIPNTYEVYADISAPGLLDRLYSEYKKFWNDDRQAKAESIGLSLLEVSVLASIVQAESVKADESKRIAGLYMNRLKKGIALQADPTLVFASGDFALKRVLNKHKEIRSPYNTYMNRGLPPGPINMPAIRSIDAVLNYEDHKYLYMCAKEDFSGYHNFAENLRDHTNNARRYQRQLSIEQRKARANSK
ncbi:endolytic transglycosylase MltG [Fulvivirga sp. M361]|uniref:endolytic transglycosylase MltG n=1 Tax=Fulvivirga sp. M361 TaxID=2594266 RepID=UPI00117B4757|nr:endolytic transglycosylase MltG [Fulvivirga sp. M361]TRX53048.1 endolytic transglycosylase MltG [Fulvivirga sp. M361]